MPETINTWSRDKVNTISLRASECKLNLIGTDADQIILEGNDDKRWPRDLECQISGQRLKIRLLHNNYRHIDLTLKLPRSKALGINLFCGKTEVRIDDIQAGLQIGAGKGEIQIEKMCGTLAIGAGHADVSIRHFTQTSMPEFAVPEEDRSPHEDNLRTRLGWLSWGEDAWQEWAADLSERISSRAIDADWWFGNFGAGKLEIKNPGIKIQTADGNIEAQEMKAAGGIFKLIKGDLKIENASFQNLDINLTRGNLEMKSAVPSGNWSLRNAHGDVQISLPANIGVRLDMLTRRGEIHSEMPLVKVTRQGPESRSGGRMVGILGPVMEGSVPEIYISAIHGNIEIRSAGKIDLQPDAKESPPPAFTPAENNGPLVILEALRAGTISVEEAEQLLHSLSP